MSVCPCLYLSISICLSVFLPYIYPLSVYSSLLICVWVCVCLTLFSHCRTGSTLSFSGTPQTTEEFSTWWWMQAKFGFLTFYCITSKLVHPIIRKKNRTEQTCHLLKAPWKGDDSVNFFAVFNPHNIKEWVKFTIFDNHNFSIGIQPNALDPMTKWHNSWHLVIPVMGFIVRSNFYNSVIYKQMASHYRKEHAHIKFIKSRLFPQSDWFILPKFFFKRAQQVPGLKHFPIQGVNSQRLNQIQGNPLWK